MLALGALTWREIWSSSQGVCSGVGRSRQDNPQSPPRVMSAIIDPYTEHLVPPRGMPLTELRGTEAVAQVWGCKWVATGSGVSGECQQPVI